MGWGLFKPPVGSQLIKGHPLAPRVGYWTVNEGSGLAVHDIVNGKDGTLTDWSSGDGSGWEVGTRGHAVTMDGVDDFIDFGDHGIHDFSGPFTAICWVELDAVQTDSDFSLFGKLNNDGPFNGWMFFVTGTYGNQGQPNLYIDAGTRITASTDIRGAGPTMVACTWDGATYRLYINGVEEGTPYSSSSAPTSSGYNLRGGSYTNNRNQLGTGIAYYLDDQCRSETELKELAAFPYQFIETPSSRLILHMSGGAPASTTTSTTSTTTTSTTTTSSSSTTTTALPPDQALPVADDFNRSDRSLAGDTCSDGTHVHEDGVGGGFSIDTLKAVPDGGGSYSSSYIANMPDTADVEVYADVGSGAGVMARVDRLNDTGYAAYVFSAGSTLSLRRVDGTFPGTQIGSYSGSGMNGATIKLRCSGSTLSVFVDGVLRIQTTDPLASYSTGDAGFAGNGGFIDNFNVVTWTPTTSTTTTTSTSTTTTSTSTTTTSTSTTTTSTTTTSTSTTSTSTTSTSTSTTSTSTTSTTTSTTSYVSTTTVTTFTFQHPIGWVEDDWVTMPTSTTSTTTSPSWPYPYGVERKAGLTYTEADKVDIVLPTASATDMDPYSIKTYVDFDGQTGVFDGAGPNRLDDGENFFDFTSLAPQFAGSVSSTTSSTSTTTTTTTTTTVTYQTTSTTTIPWYNVGEITEDAGIIESGQIRDLDVANDQRVALTEISGTPGFTYFFRFGENGDAAPTGFIYADIEGYYEGNPAHNVKIYIFNFATLDWDAFTGDAQDFPDAGSDQDYSFRSPYHQSNYIDDGKVWIKIEHTSAGSTAHRLYLDKMVLRTATSSTTTT